MIAMVSRYGKQVMICEVGMEVSAASTCKQFLSDIISKTKSVSGGLGVFYWEPECYSTWYSYYKGAFDSTGKPTVALNAFNQLQKAFSHDFQGRWEDVPPTTSLSGTKIHYVVVAANIKPIKNLANPHSSPLKRRTFSLKGETNCESVSPL